MSTEIIDPRIKKHKSIITINPHVNSYYKYKNQEFKKLDRVIYDDKQFTIAYIRNRDLIIASLDIGYDVDDEEIEDTIYMKAYEELGLDEEKEYTIHHQKASSDNNSSIYNIFISEPETISSDLSEIESEVKYIDLLIPSPLLFTTLYNNNVLEKSDAHCYVYFTMTDTFVTVYKDGEFIYSKSIEFSLEQIYDKYCALVGEKIDKDEFFEVLESEGLKTTNSVYQQNLMKLFGEVFLQINDIVIYTKRAFNIPHITKLFLGSVKSPIIGLGEYGYNYLGIPTFNLDFNFDIKNDEWYVDQLQYLMVKSGLDYLEGNKNIINISPYPRPPTFVKRSSGQFILSLIGASLLAVGMPLFYLIPSYTNEAYNLKLNRDKQKLDKEVVHYKKVLSDKQSIIKSDKKKLKELNTIFDSKAKTLTSIYDKKVNYNFKSNFFYIFAKDLKKFSVNVEKIESKDDEFTLYLLSSDEKKITKYIKHISSEYSLMIDNISIKRIEIDDKDKFYRGILKVAYR